MNYFYQKWVTKFYMALCLIMVCWAINASLIQMVQQFFAVRVWHDLELELYFDPEMINALIISLKISTLGGFFAAIICSITAYALSVFEFRFKKLILILMLIILCTPFSFQVIPLIIGTMKLGLLNKQVALWLPFLTPVLGVFVIKQFIESVISSDLIEAARMEGASEWYLFYKIIVPLILPAMVLIFLIQFSFIWYLVLHPMILAQEESMKPLSLFYGFEGLFLGNIFYTIVPILVMFLCSGYIYKFIKSDIS